MLDDMQRALIAPYVSDLSANVFALSGLPEEVIAVLFAYYSRSRDDLRTNLAKLLTDQELDISTRPVQEKRFDHASEKARAFHEKWVVGYGHASVAEHSVVHLAIENVSIVASKVIEDLRLGSYTEKSTRYVVFDQSSFIDLPNLPADLRHVYIETGKKLFSTYLDLMPEVIAELSRRSVRHPNVPEGAHVNAIRSQACDLLRGLLPAGTVTNLGLTANARSLEMLLSKMYSHPLEEVRTIAAQMHEASRFVAPTLVKYAGPNAYRSQMKSSIQEVMNSIYTPPDDGANATRVVNQPVRLLRYDKDALERIALALVYEGSEASYHAFGIIDALRRATRSELEGIIRAALRDRGKFDPVPRAFEASNMTFELMLDYGAFRDLQRHRMLTQVTQVLSARLGFDTPSELADFGFGEPYQDAMLAAHDAWQMLSTNYPMEAQYVVPLGFRVRTLWTLNLRELFHVIELRSAKQGHISYRRMAQGLYRAACSVHPWLSDLIRVDMNEYAFARA